MRMDSRSARAHEEFRAAAAHWTDRFRARREGWKDARRGLPELPATLDGSGRVRPARPGYREELQARVAVVSEKYAAEAQRRHDRLVEELMGRATDVVYHHEAGTLDKRHLGRLQSALGRWANAVQPQRSVVAGAAAEANQLLCCHWKVVERWHRRLRAIRRGRAKPPLMTGGEGRQVPFDAAAWKPEPLALDSRWEHPEEFLIRLPDVFTGDDASGYRFGPLARALEILRYFYGTPEPETGG
ncbi:hypothetical protein [Actinomadura opuntiae]|uniref:hypothetical protein n=1 Tax=Actinomadura sp. OS1-43 TaxID=604315 RepID=UPI00255ACF07|nr:hypothetical protein [Actinomadura sp. OS1-43]MDL4815012.1 hypothetical protein [Actinomadura sp. OS1-43]